MDRNNVSAKFKNEVKLVCKNVLDGDISEFVVNAALTYCEKLYLRKTCRKLGLRLRSHGRSRDITLTICRATATQKKTYELPYCKETNNTIKHTLSNYNQEFPQDLVSKSIRLAAETSEDDRILGRLGRGEPVFVSKPVAHNFMLHRMQLPVSLKKDEVLEVIKENQVTIITSETGSGKSTQIPQFILEDSCVKKVPCRIICTQPRRLSTIAVAQRVAEERGEELGDTVGYQIKMEAKLGLNTALIYCTNGILLRTLMHNHETYFNNVTHIIVDEIHERDQHIDFLLISLKRCLSLKQKLKIILMSATANVHLFTDYFQTKSVINIPGKLYEVKELYLEDILKLIDGSNYLSETDNQSYNKVGKLENGDSVDVWTRISEIDKRMNETIHNCLELGLDDSFDELMSLIVSEDADVDYQTPMGCTPLIVAAIHGKLSIVEKLLNEGANTSITYQNWTALQWTTNDEVYHLLNTHRVRNDYAHTVCHDPVDYDLILKIIISIRKEDKIGAILIFLPGYEDIQNCQQKILDSSLEADEYEIFMLHSCVDMKTQSKVFNILHEQQKIILSTNIAETSLTISDVVYVIDSGIVKEKSYDPISGISCLQAVWASKASTTQRAGRAGRTQEGICFHLFTKARYESMLQNHIPQILREPIHEICLQTKLLAPPGVGIAEYLLSAVEPPSCLSVQNAILVLKELGALTDEEELTLLGKHLVKLPIEPRFAKMLIYSVIFKCLDPILTIVACMASREPFVLPQRRRDKFRARKKQQQLAGNSLSDHLVFLNAYKLWKRATSQTHRNHRKFIKEYFLNSSIMNVIQTTRSQLLTQLKAIGFVTARTQSMLQDVNMKSNCLNVIKAIIAIGCYPNIAFSNGNNFSTKMEKKVSFQKHSAIISLVSEASKEKKSNQYCILYEELVKSGSQCIVKCSTAVSPLTIALLCGDDKKVFGENELKIDNITFKHKYSELAIFCIVLNTIIFRKIANPFYKLTTAENEVIDSLQKIFIIEEQKCCLSSAENMYNELQCQTVPSSMLQNHNVAENAISDIFHSISYWNPNSEETIGSGDINYNNFNIMDSNIQQNQPRNCIDKGFLVLNNTMYDCSKYVCTNSAQSNSLGLLTNQNELNKSAESLLSHLNLDSEINPFYQTKGLSMEENKFLLYDLSKANNQINNFCRSSTNVSYNSNYTIHFVKDPQIKIELENLLRSSTNEPYSTTSLNVDSYEISTRSKCNDVICANDTEVNNQHDLHVVYNQSNATNRSHFTEDLITFDTEFPSCNATATNSSFQDVNLQTTTQIVYNKLHFIKKPDLENTQALGNFSFAKCKSSDQVKNSMFLKDQNVNNGYDLPDTKQIISPSFNGKSHFADDLIDLHCENLPFHMPSEAKISSSIRDIDFHGIPLNNQTKDILCTNKTQSILPLFNDELQSSEKLLIDLENPLLTSASEKCNSPDVMGVDFYEDTTNKQNMVTISNDILRENNKDYENTACEQNLQTKVNYAKQHNLSLEEYSSNKFSGNYVKNRMEQSYDKCPLGIPLYECTSCKSANLFFYGTLSGEEVHPNRSSVNNQYDLEKTTASDKETMLPSVSFKLHDNKVLENSNHTEVNNVNDEQTSSLNSGFKLHTIGNKINIDCKKSSVEEHNFLTNLKESIDIVPKIIPGLSVNTAFFVIICPNYESFGNAIVKRSWQFALPTQKKIFKYFMQNYEVLLFFTISQTDKFQGLAQITNINDCSGNCCLKWLSICDISYETISSRCLLDPYSICPDEQLMEYKIGKEFCDMFFEQIPKISEFARGLVYSRYYK